jgi:Secretion system C-terminal sorting domain
MRRVQILFWLAFAIFSFLNTPLSAQTCPDPQNLSIVIDNSSPPVAHISWSVPPGSGVIGYTLTYSINGGAPVTLNLPPTPTAYTVTLPRGWETLNVSLTSICDNGGNSRTVGAKVTNIIIIDVVMRDVPLQQAVCTEPCAKSTHFYYGRNGSRLDKADPEAKDLAKKLAGDKKIAEPPAKGESPSNYHETFRNTSFCTCMTENGNDYNNQILVDACHFVAREFLDASLYNLTVCNNLGREKPVDEKPSFSSNWFLECIPNPVQDQLWIKNHFTDDNISTNYLIMNANGQVVVELENVVGDQFVGTSSWPSGIYFLRATTSAGTQKTLRILKI